VYTYIQKKHKNIIGGIWRGLTIKNNWSSVLFPSTFLTYFWQFIIPFGNWKLETGNWKLETGNWKLETRN